MNSGLAAVSDATGLSQSTTVVLRFPRGSLGDSGQLLSFRYDYCDHYDLYLFSLPLRVTTEEASAQVGGKGGGGGCSLSGHLRWSYMFWQQSPAPPTLVMSHMLYAALGS